MKKQIEKLRLRLATLRMDIGTANPATVRQYLGAIARMMARGEIDAAKARDALAKCGCEYLGT